MLFACGHTQYSNDRKQPGAAATAQQHTECDALTAGEASGSAWDKRPAAKG
jgi:hypothetical protein